MQLSTDSFANKFGTPHGSGIGRDMQRGLESSKLATDQRRHPRVRLPLRFKLHASTHHLLLVSRTVDISAGGAYLRANQEIPKGTPVRLTIQDIEPSIPIIVNATVLRSTLGTPQKRGGIAVQFEALSDYDRRRIENLLKANLA